MDPSDISSISIKYSPLFSAHRKQGGYFIRGGGYFIEIGLMAPKPLQASQGSHTKVQTLGHLFKLIQRLIHIRPLGLCFVLEVSLDLILQ